MAVVSWNEHSHQTSCEQEAQQSDHGGILLLRFSTGRACNTFSPTARAGGFGNEAQWWGGGPPEQYGLTCPSRTKMLLK